MKKTEKKYLLIYSMFIGFFIVFCSCSTSRHKFQGPVINNTQDLSEEIQGKINLLQNDLILLNDNIDLTEARQLAETSITYSLFLAEEYRVVWPPHFHNILVHVGIRDRGLCYHWADDLLNRLTLLKLKSFSLHEGVAHKGSDLREHNSVVVTARGQNFTEGIVLDPWRDSGNLYWCAVKTDRYPWKER